MEYEYRVIATPKRGDPYVTGLGTTYGDADTLRAYLDWLTGRRQAEMKRLADEEQAEEDRTGRLRGNTARYEWAREKGTVYTVQRRPLPAAWEDCDVPVA